MSEYLNRLNPRDRLSYFENALPRRWYSSSTERFERDLLNNIDDFQEFLFSRCKSILTTTRLNKKNKPDYIEAICDEKNIDRREIEDTLTLKQLLYYKTHFFNNRKASILVNIELDDFFDSLAEEHDVTGDKENIIEEAIAGDESFHKANSAVGADIWEVINNNPEPSIIHVDYPLLLAEFYADRGGDKSLYNEREGEYVDVPVIQKVVIRIDFDQELAEIQANSNAGESDIDKSKEDLEVLFSGNIEFEDEIEIDDGFIHFMEDEERVPEYVRTRYANHEGEAKSRWSGEDIRSDDEYSGEIEDRPHIDKNIEFNIPNLGNMTIGFSKEANAVQIFRKKLNPSDRRQAIHFLRKKYNDYQE